MNESQAKVLIIEDKIELADIIGLLVERMALRPIKVTLGVEAIEKIREEQPDLIVLDLGLPDMRGWRILDEVKDESGKFNTPVIVLTAHGDAANRLMGKLREVAAYLIKPCTNEEIADAISNVLALDTSVV